MLPQRHYLEMPPGAVTGAINGPATPLDIATDSALIVSASPNITTAELETALILR
jgi:hypothetical protein